MRFISSTVVQVVVIHVFLGVGHSMPQSSKNFLFDIGAFDDKHQHILNPASLITGLTHHVVGKVRDHVLTYTKSPPTQTDDTQQSDECETEDEATTDPTTRRPTLIDFIAKFKSKRDIHSSEEDCGCGGKTSIVDGIAEHVVDKMDKKSAELIVDHGDELEEASSHSINNKSVRAKRSNEDDDSQNSQSDAFGCSASSFCNASFRKKMTTTSSSQTSSCSTGTCDRIET